MSTKADLISKISELEEKINELKYENTFLKKELIDSGVYGTNPEIDKCSCPKFYKKSGPFSRVSYGCPLHGR